MKKLLLLIITLFCLICCQKAGDDFYYTAQDTETYSHCTASLSFGKDVDGLYYVKFQNESEDGSILQEIFSYNTYVELKSDYRLAIEGGNYYGSKSLEGRKSINRPWYENNININKVAITQKLLDKGWNYLVEYDTRRY